MPKRVLHLIGFLCVALSAGGQTIAWKVVNYGGISVMYPPTWHMTKERHESLTRVTLTPDSMQNLDMRLVQIYEFPTSSNHTYESFKTVFPSMLKVQFGTEVPTPKIDEISFKDHKALYAEIKSELPSKAYALNAGAAIYVIILQQRRWIHTPDPGMERDEKAILNSITFH
jgi:hypothetical protein